MTTQTNTGTDSYTLLRSQGFSPRDTDHPLYGVGFASLKSWYDQVIPGLEGDIRDMAIHIFNFLNKSARFGWVEMPRKGGTTPVELWRASFPDLGEAAQDMFIQCIDSKFSDANVFYDSDREGYVRRKRGKDSDQTVPEHEDYQTWSYFDTTEVTTESGETRTYRGLSLATAFVRWQRSQKHGIGRLMERAYRDGERIPLSGRGREVREDGVYYDDLPATPDEKIRVHPNGSLAGDDNADRRQTKRDVHEVLESLSATEKAIVLQAAKGVKLSAIAESMDMTRNNLDQIRHQMRNRLTA